MKAKNFQAYLEKRLDKSEIAEIEKLARIERNILRAPEVEGEKEIA